MLPWQRQPCPSVVQLPCSGTPTSSASASRTYLARSKAARNSGAVYSFIVLHSLANITTAGREQTIRLSFFVSDRLSILRELPCPRTWLLELTAKSNISTRRFHFQGQQHQLSLWRARIEIYAFEASWPASFGSFSDSPSCSHHRRFQRSSPAGAGQCTRGEERFVQFRNLNWLGTAQALTLPTVQT